MNNTPPMDMAALADAVTVRLDKARALLSELQQAENRSMDMAKVHEYAQNVRSLLDDAHRMHAELWKKVAKSH